jgi:MFS transporter, FSR family, fosmidomycin resistance protein
MAETHVDSPDPTLIDPPRIDPTRIHPITPPTPAQAWTIVLLLALGHMCVDAASIFAATHTSTAAVAINYESAVRIILIYNLLAFATQPLCGFLTDWLRQPAAVAALGALLAVAGILLCGAAPTAALFLAGLGNALYHVGAGSICLSLSGGRAAMPGVFTAPGGFGVILGTFIGRGDWIGVPALIAGGALTAMYSASLALGRSPTEDCRLHVGRAQPAGAVRMGVVLLLLGLAIAARSRVSGALTAPWLDVRDAWIGLAVAAELGKLTGAISDRIGWIAFAVPCALLAAPLAAWGSKPVIGAMVAMALVQCTMPVTLAGASRVLPGRPALAFGLCSLAIVLGALPGQLPLPLALPAQVFVIQLAAAVAILVGLLATGLRWGINHGVR